jgi:hypothetical protein
MYIHSILYISAYRQAAAVLLDGHSSPKADGAFGYTNVGSKTFLLVLRNKGLPFPSEALGPGQLHSDDSDDGARQRVHR